MPNIKLATPIIARRGGVEVRVPLPVRNTVQGGEHGKLAAIVGGRKVKYDMSDLSIQERHLIPNTFDMARNQEMSNTIQDVAMNLIFGTAGMKVMGTCNEGGIGAFFRKHGESGAWRIMRQAVRESGFELGKDVFFGVDGAADNWYEGNGIYKLDGKNFDVKQLMEFYQAMMVENPIIYAEDLFASRPEAWDHWAALTEEFGHQAFVSLDDIATTNARLVRPLIAHKAGNMLLLKMNQIGTMMEGWRAAEEAHRAGLMSISSHRSTSSVDMMEIEVALALSMLRPGMGRTIFAKCGGAKLIERAMRYSKASQWVQDWMEGLETSTPLRSNMRIKKIRAYAAPLNTGALTTGIRAVLSNGVEVEAIVPAGTSTGETEAALVPTKQAVDNVNTLVRNFGLEGMRIGDLPDQYTFTMQLLTAELMEAKRTNIIGKNATPLDIQIAAERKQALGANALLALSVLFNRLIALKEGKPSWLSFREAGFAMNSAGATEHDEIFYEPVVSAVLSVPKRASTHLIRDYVKVREQLSEQHRDELAVIDRAFEIAGSLTYDVELRKEGDELVPHLKMRPNSKIGVGEHYQSRAEEEFQRAWDSKGHTIVNHEIWVDPVRQDAKELEGTYYVAVPFMEGENKGRITLFIGRFNDESLDPEKRSDLFRFKFKQMKRLVWNRNVPHSEQTERMIENAFNSIPIAEFFTKPTQTLFEEYILRMVNGKQET